tara:strand:- start:495 stop:752 length:258 start_codon:yes stop_codon:yes gene_type:complete
MKVKLVNGTLTKSITRNEDGETEVTVKMDGENTGMPMMNQTINIEAKPLESVEAFGVKAESSNILFALMAVIVMIACWRLLKKWY